MEMRDGWAAITSLDTVYIYSYGTAPDDWTLETEFPAVGDEVLMALDGDFLALQNPEHMENNPIRVFQRDSGTGQWSLAHELYGVQDSFVLSAMSAGYLAAGASGDNDSAGGVYVFDLLGL